MDHQRIDKVMTAWGALGTLGMLATSAVLAAPPRAAPTLPQVLDTTGTDARLDQFVADARALWPELSPEVRAMVIELVRARARPVERVSPAAPADARAQVPGVQATQAIVTE